MSKGLTGQPSVDSRLSNLQQSMKKGFFSSPDRTASTTSPALSDVGPKHTTQVPDLESQNPWEHVAQQWSKAGKNHKHVMVPNPLPLTIAPYLGAVEPRHQYAEDF